MISAAIGTFKIDPELLVVPGSAIFVTASAFHRLGDGLCDALIRRARGDDVREQQRAAPAVSPDPV